MHTTFWSENLRERDHLENMGVDERILLKLILMRCGVKVWIGFMRLRILLSGKLL